MMTKCDRNFVSVYMQPDANFHNSLKRLKTISNSGKGLLDDQNLLTLTVLYSAQAF